LCRQRNDAGVAAIEFVIVLPVLLLLFFGMINLTSYISTLRKTNAAAELVTDLVSRHDETITSSDIDEYFNAAALLFLPASGDGVQVQLYNYHDDDKNGVADLRWGKFKTAGTCTAPNTSAPEIVTMLADSDVLIAVACIPGYEDPARFPGLPTLAVPQKSVALRPRQSRELNCTDCPPVTPPSP
jgi:Flp pilus assembly protein TadG